MQNGKVKCMHLAGHIQRAIAMAEADIEKAIQAYLASDRCTWQEVDVG